jgi:hypothetical protein
MRLTNENIEKVSDIIVQGLIEKKLIRLKAQRDKVKARVKKVITDELKKEEALDREVNALIEKNKGLIGKESLDHTKMFNMIKKKLAKEKGVVL